MSFAAELSVGHRDNVMTHPQDEEGLIDLDSILGQSQVVDTLVYACGPAALLDAVAERCKNWQPDTLHVERFTSVSLEKATTGRSSEVTLARSGMTLTVAGEQSILCRSDWIRHGGAPPPSPRAAPPRACQCAGQCPMFADRTPLRLAELLEQSISGFQPPKIGPTRSCQRRGRPPTPPPTVDAPAGHVTSTR